MNKKTEEFLNNINYELSEYAYQKTLVDNDPCATEDPFGKKNYQRMKRYLKARVKPGRYEHSISVAKTAERIAKAYGEDAAKAKMAGLLHDWDKALSYKHLRKRIRDYKLNIDPDMLTEMPWVLHGPTGAAVLRHQFPELGEDVCQAIERHTVGAPKMSSLDMIIFAADKLEPLHDVPAYRKIAKKIGKIPLEELFFKVQKQGLLYLIESDRPLNRDSAAVWNYYIGKRS